MAIRTPEERFKDLPDFPYEPKYVDVGDARMSYVESGEGNETILCLHGEPTWSFLYRKMIPTLSEKGRVIAPDLIGFGRSDKYTDMEDYTFTSEYEALETLIQELDLENVTLVGQDWGGILGLYAVKQMPDRFSRIVPMNTGLPDGTQEMPDEWIQFRDFVKGTDDLPIGFLIDAGCLTEVSDEVKRGYEAPFPDPSYMAGARAMPLRVPTSPDDKGAEEMRETREFLSEWDKPAFVLFSDSDPITRPSRDFLRDLIPTAKNQPDTWVEGAGHFLQEDRGEEVAKHIVKFIEETSRR
ncbi:MAG: haloalkane dehalogenase [Halobacteria archaeon]|nr:haloalkane dehalogenase [Halobacteria archaeon]